MRCLDDASALGLGILAGLKNDVCRLTAASVTSSSYSLREAIAFFLVVSASFQTLLDTLTALIHHREDLRPSELGEHHPDDKESDQRRDELGHLGMRISALLEDSSANAWAGTASTKLEMAAATVARLICFMLFSFWDTICDFPRRSA